MSYSDDQASPMLRQRNVYRRKLIASLSPPLTSLCRSLSHKRLSHSCVEGKSHPLDPNQILIAYEGGTVLYNITERHTIRTYEYIILPGAPGGHDDQTEGAFLERRPMCTCLAWRPDGRMFAAGYDDGSFALWSIEDGDSKTERYMLLSVQMS